MVAVLGRGGDWADEETSRKMVTLLQQMQRSLPPEVMHPAQGLYSVGPLLFYPSSV
jgi:hypothetical protein